MNKFLLVILFVASACFALNVVGESPSFNYYGEPNPGYFRLDNKGGGEIKGVKVYYYIDIYDIKNYASYYSKKPFLMDGSVKVPGGFNLWGEKVAYNFRIVFNLVKETIPAGGVYPNNGYYLKWMYDYIDNHIVGKYFGLQKKQLPDLKLENFVVESTSGKVLYGKHPENNKRIGFLSYDGCTAPGWADITLDVEDSKNKTRLVSGAKNPPGFTITGGKVKFSVCFANYEKIPRVPFDYVVFRGDEHCPKGTYAFRRRHDTEDSNNKNSVSGNVDIWPSVVGDNASLEYCFVPADSKSKLDFPFKNNYLTSASGFGVFANVNTENIAHSEVYIDDEDSKNNNKWDFYGASEDIQKRIRKIVNGSNNTTYHFAKWRGYGTDNWYAKNAVSAKELAVGEPGKYVLKEKALSPMIKGVDRTSVFVELKSAGNVKISVVNVNGAVVASVAQENLEPGIHQIKWNSGAEPKGRYVVKVQQNGMVDAKNVILK